jgi:hypothetical protein
MGEITVQEVLRRIRNKSTGTKLYILEAELIICASTKPNVRTE